MVSVPLDDCEPGWILKFPRKNFREKTGNCFLEEDFTAAMGDLCYYHYAVYIGDGRIVHLDSSGIVDCICISEYYTRAIPENADREKIPIPPDEIVKFAEFCSVEGLKKECLVKQHNSKWFAEMCRYGPHS